jgi:predicted ester cyclase
MKRVTRLFLGVILTTGFLGCQDKDRDSPTKSSESVGESVGKSVSEPQADGRLPEVYRLFESALEDFNTLNFDGAASLFADDHECILSDYTAKPIKGRRALVDRWKEIHLAFPDVRVDVKRILDGGKFWVFEGVITGTHHGDFLGREGSMKKLGCHLAIFSWVKDNRIQKSFICGNPLAVLKQMKSAAKTLPPGLIVPDKPEVLAAPGNPARVEAVRTFFRSFETADLAMFSKLVASDVAIHAYGDGREISGLESLMLAMVKEREAFDGRIDVEEAVAVGPYVAALVHVHGTLRGGLGAGKSGGNPISVRGVDVFRFQGGKIKEWDNHRNLMDLLKQVGLFPPPEK